MQTKEIDLLDMIADILSHWRGLLIALVCGAVLLGMYSYMNSFYTVQKECVQETVDQDKTAVQKQLMQMEESMEGSKKAAVLTTVEDEKEYEIKKTYFENSVYMQLNSLQVSQTELVYHIQTADVNQDMQSIMLYELLLNNVGLYEWVAGQTGIDASSAKELISLESVSKLKVQGATQESVLEIGSNSLKVTILQADEDSCRQLTETVKSYISDATDLELALISETSGVVINKDVMSEQVKYGDELTSLQTAIETAKEGFTEDQKQYYDLLTWEETETEQEPKTEETTTVSPAVSKKYVVLGAVLFAFVYAMILAMGYIFNTKVRVSDELQQIYGIPQIGLVVKESGKKLFLDKWIDSLRNYGRRKFTAEQSMELAFAAIKIAAVKNGQNSICLIGCNMNAGAGKVCESLKAALEKEQIRVTVLDNVLYDAEAMEKVDAMQGAVLVEKAGSTLYNEINDELALLKRQEILVLGGIIVE